MLFFECTISHKANEDSSRPVNHKYVFRADTYSEAETYCHMYMQSESINEFSIEKIVKTDVNEYQVENDNGEKVFSVKFVSVYIDDNDEEKVADKFHYLVRASDINNVIPFIKNGTTNDIVIVELKRTSIIEVVTDIHAVESAELMHSQEEENV